MRDRETAVNGAAEDLRNPLQIQGYWLVTAEGLHRRTIVAHGTAVRRCLTAWPL